MSCPCDAHSYVFLGEAGSGKTELSVNCAIHLARTQNKQVCFFDMDQTKGLFRARDLQKQLEDSGVVLFDTIQFQDSPVVPLGVTGALENEDSICVFDVGGNAIGSRMIGQYSRYLDKACCFYVVNPNRPFSSKAPDVKASMEQVLSASRIPMERVRLVSNPCMGEETSVESILRDHQKLVDILATMGMSPSMLTVDKKYFDAVRTQLNCSIFPIQLYVKNLYKT